MRENKWYFPRRVFEVEDGKDNERNKFYSFLGLLEELAMRKDSRWGDFYHYTVYTLANGSVYEYCEDTEYGVPYSLEKLEGVSI